MSGDVDDKLREEGQARARSTAVWEPSFCRQDYWDYHMSQIPHDAIGADQTKHAPHGSYSPKFWYRNETFACQDCGKVEIWTAEEQRWWFEVAKGPIYSRAIRCRACRLVFRVRTGKLSHAERRQGNAPPA